MEFGKTYLVLYNLRNNLLSTLFINLKSETTIDCSLIVSLINSMNVLTGHGHGALFSLSSFYIIPQTFVDHLVYQPHTLDITQQLIAVYLSRPSIL